MNPVAQPPVSLQSPGRGLTLSLVSAAGLVLGGLLVAVLIRGPDFSSFPGRTIGISLLSNVDPHYRISLFLLASALTILLAFTAFTLVRNRADALSLRPMTAITTLVLTCVIANAMAAALHADQSLFSAAACHSAFLLVLWVWSQRPSASLSINAFVLRFALAWQISLLIFWLLGLSPNAWVYLAVTALWLALDLTPEPFWHARATRSLQAAALTAPLAMIVAIELTYFWLGSSNTSAYVLAIFSLVSAATVAAAALRPLQLSQLAWLGAAAVLVSNLVITQYDNQLLYKGYDLFHLPEKLLPLHQWQHFRSIPFIDYHPGHGVFDMLPHGIYQWFNRGNLLESLVWGNGYFLGWTVQALYVFLLFGFLASIVSTAAAFFLLWLLPILHVLEPYNTLLLLPLFNLLTLPTSQRPKLRWALQWGLTLALGFWRVDFGLIVLVGNLIVAAAHAWHHKQLSPLRDCLLMLAAITAALLALVLAGDTALLLDRILRSVDLMQIQILAASYDHFYKTWNALAWMQYVVMPLLGACAGAYSLSQVYRRNDSATLGLHLIVIFLTAIGFALSIRLFQRHTLAEGMTRTNFFYFAPLLLLATLTLTERWRSTLLVLFFMGSFLLTPKTEVYKESSLWGPRKTYPVTTHTTAFPELLSGKARLEDRVSKYDSYKDFMGRYLRPGESIYDFANAPMLYMLAGVKLPVFVYETVWHTSEKVQHSTLLELDALRRQDKLPLIVFRQNKPRWDALDGVDNALRSYHVAEYIYRHYSPCLRVGRFDLWIANDRPCPSSLQGSLADADTQPLSRNYLSQAIDFGSLPYLWANYDTAPEVPLARRTLPVRRLPTGVLDLAPGAGDFCSGESCYLDLVISSPQAVTPEIRLAGKKLASFDLRAGTHRYRLRISALWRWHQSGRGALRLAVPEGVAVSNAHLVRVPAMPLDSGNT